MRHLLLGVDIVYHETNRWLTSADTTILFAPSYRPRNATRFGVFGYLFSFLTSVLKVWSWLLTFKNTVNRETVLKVYVDFSVPSPNCPTVGAVVVTRTSRHQFIRVTSPSCCLVIADEFRALRTINITVSWERRDLCLDDPDKYFISKPHFGSFRLIFVWVLWLGGRLGRCGDYRCFLKWYIMVIIVIINFL